MTSRPATTRVQRVCYAIAVTLAVSGLFHFGVLMVTGGSWLGPVSWRKPATFGVSFGLTLATIAWVTTYLRLGRRTLTWLLSLFAGACVLEVSLTAVQAWRRIPSHFNVETPVDELVGRMLAAGGGVLIVVIAVLAVASWRVDQRIAPSMRLAVRAGFAWLAVSMLIGVYMIATGIGRARAGDPQTAYAVGGALKPGHAVAMHAVLVLPVLAWLLMRTRLPEGRRVRVMWLAVTGYTVVAGVVVAESFLGIDPLRAPAPATVVAASGVLALGTAGLVTLAGLTRRES